MKRIILIGLIFIIGILTGILSNKFYRDFKKNTCLKLYKFIDRELICSRSLIIVKKHSYIKLKNKLIDFIYDERKKSNITHVSLYFRDLVNGPILGINEQEEFSPASLLKLPLLITYLRLAEEDKNLLKKKILYTNKIEISQNFEPSRIIDQTTRHEIGELLNALIIYSDNVAYYWLVAYLRQAFPKRNPLLETNQELGILEPKNTLEDTITVRSYGSIFRSLYYGTYLSEVPSEQALGLLAKSEFDKGIAAGVPKELAVANKFGERATLNSKIKQLHDCGIIYYPNNPYLLCIMTKGEDFEKLAKIITDLSRMVYEEFNSRKIN